MFNALLCAEYSNFFNFDSLLGITVCVGIILLGLMVLSNIILFFIDKKKVKISVVIDVIIMLVYLVVVVILNINDTASGGGFDSENTGMASEGEGGIIVFNTSNAVWISVAVIVVFGILIGLLLIDRKKVAPRAHTLSLVYAALSVALATGLSYIKMFEAPYGGSITLFSLLPIALYSYMFGVRRGTLAGFIYGLLQLLQGPNILHPLQFFLDYIIPFAVFGLCGGVFRPLVDRSRLNPQLKALIGLTSGLVLATVMRYIFHVISGAVYFGEYAGDYGFDNAWTYSAVYNALYVFPDGAICVAGGLLLMLSASFRGQIDRVTNAFKKGNIRKGAKAMAALVTDGAVGGDAAGAQTDVAENIPADTSVNGAENTANTAAFEDRQDADGGDKN